MDRIDGYIELGFESDPDEIAQDAFDFIVARIANWEPAEGNLDVIIVELVAHELAISHELAQQVAEAAFRQLGRLFGVGPLDPTPATAASTWTLTDEVGHLILAGTQVTLAALDGGEPVGFEVLEDVVVEALSDATATGEVQLRALEAGDRGSGLTGPVELVDALAWVDGVAIEGVTVGGTDGETTTAYADRLARRLRLMAVRVIRPEDAEALVLDIAGVGRATAIDLYKADTDDHDVERCLSVAVVDSQGEPCSSEIKTAARTLLEAEREVNFLTFVIDPTYTEIDVEFTVEPRPGWEAEAVNTAVVDALNAYLSPGSWGLPESGVGWHNQTTVRYLEVASLIDRVPGVDYVVELGICEHEGAPGTADVDLDGVAPLPRPGTITATVVE